MPRREDGSICYSDTHYRDTWVAMESLVDKGLVRAIGLSNFNARQTDDILSLAKHRPVLNQVESHPYLSQTHLLSYCQYVKLRGFFSCSTGLSVLDCTCCCGSGQCPCV